MRVLEGQREAKGDARVNALDAPLAERERETADAKSRERDERRERESQGESRRS